MVFFNVYFSLTDATAGGYDYGAEYVLYVSELCSNVRQFVPEFRFAAAGGR